MIIKLNVVDRKQRQSHFFYDTIAFLLLDDKGYPVLDIESHPFRSDTKTPNASLMAGASVAERLAMEPEHIQQYNCQRKIEDFLQGKAISSPLHAPRAAAIMDNFLVTPCPRHNMEWLGFTNSDFYYNFPYFVVVILGLTGKLVVSLEREEVELVYKT